MIELAKLKIRINKIPSFYFKMDFVYSKALFKKPIEIENYDY